jgi:hypothetical protein
MDSYPQSDNLAKERVVSIYDTLREELAAAISRNGLSGKSVGVRCRALSAVEAIGAPMHDDYPILKGKEVMVEASFEGARGQAFSDSFENADYPVEALPEMALNSNRDRASFVAGLNAVYRHLGACDRTTHCKDEEPRECAKHLWGAIGERDRVLLVGYQPRFLEALAARSTVRVVDLDDDNIGSSVAGVAIEPPENTRDAMSWCDLVVATGSTLVNGTIVDLMSAEKPVLFYGITISAAAEILKLDRFCHCGH